MGFTVVAQFIGRRESCCLAMNYRTTRLQTFNYVSPNKCQHALVLCNNLGNHYDDEKQNN